MHQKMLVKGIAPSIRTINTMIRVPESPGIPRILRKWKLVFHILLISCLGFSVHGHSRELNKAIEMVGVAHSFNLSLDEKAYMNLIHFCSRAGETEEASLLFSKVREEGIKPGKVSSTTTMNVYGSSGSWLKAEDLFSAMKGDGIVSDSSMYLSLIRAYTNNLKIV